MRRAWTPPWEPAAVPVPGPRPCPRAAAAPPARAPREAWGEAPRIRPAGAGSPRWVWGPRAPAITRRQHPEGAVGAGRQVHDLVLVGVEQGEGSALRIHPEHPSPAAGPHDHPTARDRRQRAHRVLARAQDRVQRASRLAAEHRAGIARPHPEPLADERQRPHVAGLGGEPRCRDAPRAPRVQDASARGDGKEHAAPPVGGECRDHGLPRLLVPGLGGLARDQVQHAGGRRQGDEGAALAVGHHVPHDPRPWTPPGGRARRQAEPPLRVEARSLQRALDEALRGGRSPRPDRDGVRGHSGGEEHDDAQRAAPHRVEISRRAT